MPDTNFDRGAFYAELDRQAGSTWPQNKDLLMEATPYRGVSFVVVNDGTSISFSESFYRVEPVSRFQLVVNGTPIQEGSPITRERYRKGEQTRDCSTTISGNSLLEIVERSTGDVIFWARAEFTPPVLNQARMPSSF